MNNDCAVIWNDLIMKLMKITIVYDWWSYCIFNYIDNYLDIYSIHDRLINPGSLIIICAVTVFLWGLKKVSLS